MLDLFNLQIKLFFSHFYCNMTRKMKITTTVGGLEVDALVSTVSQSSWFAEATTVVFSVFPHSFHSTLLAVMLLSDFCVESLY